MRFAVDYALSRCIIKARDQETPTNTQEETAMIKRSQKAVDAEKAKYEQLFVVGGSIDRGAVMAYAKEKAHSLYKGQAWFKDEQGMADSFYSEIIKKLS